MVHTLLLQHFTRTNLINLTPKPLVFKGSALFCPASPQRPGSGWLREKEIKKLKEKERKKKGEKKPQNNETVIKSPDKRMTVLCRSWYQCYLSVFFFALQALLLFFSPYLAAPKCQEQKGEKERNYRTDYSWGLADKMLMPKLRLIQTLFSCSMSVFPNDICFLKCKGFCIVCSLVCW